MSLLHWDFKHCLVEWWKVSSRFSFQEKMVNLSVVQIGCNTIMFNHVRERLCMSNVKTLDLKKSMIKNKQNIKAVENHFMCENLINLNIIIIINDKLWRNVCPNCRFHYIVMANLLLLFLRDSNSSRQRNCIFMFSKTLYMIVLQELAGGS